MKSRDRTIYPLPFKEGSVPAVMRAREFYAQHSEMNFEEDLTHYLAHGFVCSYPNVFGMCKVIVHKGQLAWFIHMAVGDMLELAQILPFYLPKILWCRNNEKDVLREYSLDRVMRLVIKLRGGQNGRRRT